MGQPFVSIHTSRASLSHVRAGRVPPCPRALAGHQAMPSVFSASSRFILRRTHAASGGILLLTTRNTDYLKSCCESGAQVWLAGVRAWGLASRLQSSEGLQGGGAPPGDPLTHLAHGAECRQKAVGTAIIPFYRWKLRSSER